MLYRRIKNWRNNTDERPRAERARLIPHLLQLPRAGTTLLEPLLVFAGWNRAPPCFPVALKVFPDFFRQLFRNAIRREEHLTNSTLWGFAQRLSLLF